MNERKMAILFKSFADENRIHILRILRDGEKCACHLLEELNISQPTLSHHMKILCDAGIVSARKEGKWMHYRICREGIQGICDLLAELLDGNCEPSHCCQ